MYSRSAKGGEKGDPNCNPWLAKMCKLVNMTSLMRSANTPIGSRLGVLLCPRSYKLLRRGTYKVRNEIETKRNEINKNQTKRNEINEMKTK